MFPWKFIEKIHNYEITLDEARNNQSVLGILINKLSNNFNSKIPKKVKEKNNILKSARKLLDVRIDIDFFEKGFFPYKGHVFKTKKEELEKESEEESEEERFKKFIKYIENESKGINYDLFRDYFNFVVPSALVKKN